MGGYPLFSAMLSAFCVNRARVYCIYGNCLELEVDVLVNPSNGFLYNDGGMSGAIQKAAGPDMSAACSAALQAAGGYLDFGRAVLTPGFQLRAKHVAHAVAPMFDASVPQQDAMFRSCVREAVRLAAEHSNVTSIAIPAIGTGTFKWPVDVAVREIARAILAVATEGGLGNIQHIVLFDLLEAKAKQFARVVEALAGQGSAVTADMTCRLHSPQWLQGDYGSATEGGAIGGPDPLLGSVDWSKVLSVPEHGYVMCGPVSDAKVVVNKWRAQLKERERTQRADGFENDREYNQRLLQHPAVAAVCSKHEMKLALDSSGNITATFFLDAAIHELNSVLGNAKKEVMLPTTWAPMHSVPACGYTLVSVPLDSSEGKEVAKVFATNGFSHKPTAIERVQNPRLWERFFTTRQTLLRHKGGANVLQLFHGSRDTDPAAIAQMSFDFRHSKAGYFGRGAYFAESMAYSDTYAHKQAGTGRKQVFIALVCAGDVDERGKQRDSSIVKPAAGKDSVRGEVAASHSAVIVYDLGQAYPQYLVTYS